jgi:uncharacterized membrane protein YphA (DoxX/SURF4 family)
MKDAGMKMRDNTVAKKSRIRDIITMVASIFVGLTLLISSTGKLLDFGMIPGQTAEFIGFILPDALLTPTTVYFIYDILIPYIIPVLELVLGVSLLMGFVPRLVATICIPLTWIFMANNVFSISRGMNKYDECPCFGIWGKIFGTMTPVQSLIYDIVLFGLALVIIFIYTGGFLQSNNWLRNLRKKKQASVTA